MFRNTRLKLTGWYLLMIMLISIFFSIVIYANVDRELVNFESYTETKRERILSNFGSSALDPISTAVDSELISEARGRLITNLAILNAVILVGSTIAGYFLAGRTLQPIKEMLDRQSRFIGDAAHELKTPLTSLRSEIEVYMLSKKQTKSEADAILKSNLEEVIRLQNLSDSFMQLTSFEHKELLNIPLVRTKLHPLVENAIRKIEPQAKERNIKIKCNVKNATIFADEKSLIQLFIILIDNAVKYSPSRSKVTVSTKISENVLIMVKDEGIGIKEGEISHIFDRFYRADESRSSTDIKGHGLGLSIAQEIARLHNGVISVTSKPSQGSVFTVALPRH